jgi:COP9 signalosome complex subunit 3
MSGDLLTVLLQFQPDSEELKQRRDYDQAARSFVSQLNNISASHWSKGVDTPQDVLAVCIQ